MQWTRWWHSGSSAACCRRLQASCEPVTQSACFSGAVAALRGSGAAQCSLRGGLHRQGVYPRCALHARMVKPPAWLTLAAPAAMLACSLEARTASSPMCTSAPPAKQGRAVATKPPRPCRGHTGLVPCSPHGMPKPCGMAQASQRAVCWPMPRCHAEPVVTGSVHVTHLRWPLSALLELQAHLQALGGPPVGHGSCTAPDMCVCQVMGWHRACTARSGQAQLGMLIHDISAAAQPGHGHGGGSNRICIHAECASRKQTGREGPMAGHPGKWFQHQAMPYASFGG